MNLICEKCQRSVEPKERVEYDEKAKASWLITYCPYDRCGANMDIQRVKYWNGKKFSDSER